MQHRWGYQLSVLRGALDRLDALHAQWLRNRDSLPVDARSGTPVFDGALAEHHAECWSHLDDWATHGQAIRDIHTAARYAPSPVTSPPTATTSLSTASSRTR
ncbi:hypothetical protein ACFSJS_09475 [Streptomyces desertarenae]|uniref:Uncharacterized protein n=1 Tax=Streptomyces desertarenae TaxID=2666184 RepID=A0ABW4PIK1_9ACTN